MNTPRRISIIVAVAWAIGGVAYAQVSPTAEARCAGMRSNSAPGLSVDSAELLGGSFAPGAGADPSQRAQCKVEGVLTPHKGDDGRDYGVRFQLRMPIDWNGRFLFQGGAGTDGLVAPAFGATPLAGSTAEPALARGFAVVSTDAGHKGRDASFGRDPQARRDYGYGAIQKLAPAATMLIKRFYGAAPRRSYFMGCSNGGRQGFVAAQRLPSLFDGVVAGAPGFDLTDAAIGEMWDTRTLLNIAPKDGSGRPILSQALTPKDLDLVAKAVLDRCDQLDGLKDGMINDVKACRFDFARLTCKAAASTDCLSSNKVVALKTIFEGAKDSHGRRLYATWPVDTGIAGQGWRAWKLGFSPTSQSDAANATLGRASLGSVFMTPPDPAIDPATFDFDHAKARTAEAAMEIDAVSPDLRRFQAHGGKLLIYQGVSDPVFSADGLLAWYDLAKARNANLSRDLRLFLVPGMNHCGGGPSTDDFDPLSVLVDWVEHDKAPERIIAKGDQFPGLTRPLCAYPSVARYQGGDPKRETSFTCR